MKYIKKIIDFDRTKMSSSDLVNNINFNQEIINTILSDAWYKEELGSQVVLAAAEKTSEPGQFMKHHQ